MTQPSLPAPVSGSAVRPKRGRSFLIVVFLGVLAAFWLGSVQNALRERARNPYPKTQNGLTLLAHHTARIQSAPNTPLNLIIKWINNTNQRLLHNKAFVTDTEFPSIEVELPLPTQPGHFLATARSSSGETFILPGDDLFAGAFPAVSAGTRPAHTFVHLPTVPGSYQWLDVTLDDKKGHRGTWRVFDLPRLKHALLPTTPLHETATVQKISVQARAWWDAKAAPPQTGTLTRSHTIPVVMELKADVPPAALSRLSQSWGVRITSVTPEWDDPLRVPLASGGGSGVLSGSSGRGIAGAGTAYAEATNAVAPHPAAQHIVQIEAKLTQYDAMQELVTFHNLPLEPDGKGWRVHLPPGGLWQETASGVRVLFTSPSAPSPTDDPMEPNEVRVSYRLAPQNVSLPRSVLQQRVGMKHPLRLSASVDISGMGVSTMLSGEAPNTTDRFARLTFERPITRPVLPQLTICVYQEAELQSLPVTFIMPVRAGKPKQKWD